MTLSSPLFWLSTVLPLRSSTQISFRETHFKYLIIFGLSLLFSPKVVIGQEIKKSTSKILMVVSSYGKDAGKSRPGFEMNEFTQAYYIFKDNNIAVEVASPKGGKVESDKYSPNSLYSKRFLGDPTAQSLLDKTLATATLVNESYNAVYVVGGKGAMFDLPVDPSLQEIIAKIYTNNGIVSAVCHGSAAFVNIKVGGEFILKSHKITGFCNSEEEKFGKVWIKELPYLLESKLIERGSIYKKGEDMLPFVIASGNFITGQNPFSTTWVAEEIVKALGIQPKSREQYPDEKSMLLVKRVLNGEQKWALEELRNNKETFDIQLIGAYGYFGLMNANDEEKKLKESLSIIELVSDFFFNENYQMERAIAHNKLGNKSKAKTLLEDLIKKNLLTEKAQNLLSTINL